MRNARVFKNLEPTMIWNPHRNHAQLPYVFSIVKPICAMAALLTFAMAEAQPAPMPADFVQKAEAHIDAYAKAGRFTGSILIAKDGKVVLRKSYGFADYSTHRPMTPETPVPIFSVSKSFTAGAILLLQEKGLLSVNDKASKYVNDLPTAWKDITIHQLLTHTSGISLADQITWAAKHFGSAFRKAADGDQPKASKPGSKFEYSNVGYMLLGVIVAKVSGKPYDTFIDEAIFKPLGMTGAGAGGHWEGQNQVARGHTVYGGQLVPFDQRLSIITGAGDLHGNVDDLLKWRTAIDNPGLFSEESRKALHSSFVAVDNERNYSYGWFYHTQWPYWEHTGGGAGCETSLQWFPERGVTIVILKNCDASAASLISIDEELAAMAYARPPSPPKFERLDVLDRYQGVYRTPKFGDIVVSVAGDTVMLYGLGSEPKAMDWVDGRQYEYEGCLFEFEPRPDGLFNLRITPQDKDPRLATRVVPAAPLTEYTGVFGEAGGQKIELRGLWLTIGFIDDSIDPDPFLVALLPSGKDRFLVPSFGVEFVFIRDKKGKITSINTLVKGKVANVSPKRS